MNPWWRTWSDARRAGPFLSTVLSACLAFLAPALAAPAAPPASLRPFEARDYPGYLAQTDQELRPGPAGK